jgi:hypothetical protein
MKVTIDVNPCEEGGCNMEDISFEMPFPVPSCTVFSPSGILYEVRNDGMYELDLETGDSEWVFPLNLSSAVDTLFDEAVIFIDDVQFLYLFNS